MKKIFVGMTLGLWISFSYGQVFSKPEGKSCSTLEGRLEYINKVSSEYYDWLLKKVERVPPDTEKYISQEYRDAFETRNEVKYNNVISNKYFYSWKLRTSIQKFVDESKDGYNKLNIHGSSFKNSQENEMIFYINLLEKNFNVSEEFETYGRFDRGRKPRVLSEEKDSFTFSFYKNGYGLIIRDLIKCSFKK